MSDNGDWGEWLHRHGPALLLYARQWAPTLVDAEDLLQEAFVRFWQSRRSPEDPRPYLFACVRNCGIDGARARGARKKHERLAGTRQQHEVWFEARLERKETYETVQSALSRLPAEQREVVVLKIWGELTFEQIGRTMESSPNTAASRYRYALENLQRDLEWEDV